MIDMKTVLKKLISAVYASPDIKERDKIVFDVGGGESVLYYSGSIELDCIQSVTVIIILKMVRLLIQSNMSII